MAPAASAWEQRAVNTHWPITQTYDKAPAVTWTTGALLFKSNGPRSSAFDELRLTQPYDDGR